ncbi:LOW QUALITY PROTEIN: aldehyde oxidase 1-like [Melanotaenia boesemani]|uniref:LOW QUALITY PROTEIN: aldehyde oxidase 1-like n=1 Tax=Melanotaenia boesemani TaxID=1250792 RepID=UPI001C056985|nr:LOW QUALITY PROTEIN: aldehyde oxidase 1-like [Melanotaenia boesemani]
MFAAKKGDTLCVFINGKKVTEDHADPETMLLSFLRENLRLTGTKSGCGGGGCGACTVMVSRYRPTTKTIFHYSANACLLPLCQLHGAAITTVEGIGNSKTRIHPVQERIAKAHGSQCGFCTPGMVMSMYALLRNKPWPTMEDITQALAGNLCRCTGYRPIVDGCRSFCQESSCCQSNGDEKTTETKHEKPRLFDQEEFLPLDPTQDLIFPPELILMAETANQQTLTFCGERSTWVSPASLEELVQLKIRHPTAPLVMGNTNTGPDMKFKGVLHPLIISPSRVPELFEVSLTPRGVWVGAGCSLSEVRCLLEKLLLEFPEEETELFRALIQQLGNLGSQQIRNVASLGGNVVSAYPNSDLNPVLAAGNGRVSVVSGGGRREVPLDQDFFVGFGKTLLEPEEVVVSVFIPFTRKCSTFVCPAGGSLFRALRHAPRKEPRSLPLTTGMRVCFSEGSRVVQDISIYYGGGLGPTTVSATKTCKAIVGRPWDEGTLSQAYNVLLDELVLPPSAPGGKVDFRRSLTLSLLFKFNLEVLQKLKEMNVIPDELPEKLLPLPGDIQPSLQEFQPVSDSQSVHDPVGRPMMHRSAVSHATGEAIYCDDMPRTDGELFLVLVTSSRALAKIINLDVSAAMQLPGVVDVITAKDIPGKKERAMFGYSEELLAENKIREANMYTGPSATHYRMEFSPENMLRCWEDCKVRSDYNARRRAVHQFNQHHRWKKRGLSIIPIKYGVAFAESFLNQAAALVHVYKDGSVLVSHGGTEMGQGIHTKMQQVASRELHIPSSKIYISETSTSTVPNTCPSAASFGTDANGMAVKNACETLYQRLKPIREKNPKGSWETWVRAAFFEKISLSATGYHRGPDLYMDWDKMEGQPYAYFVFGVCCSEVELDCLTGDYRTVRTDIVVDIGRSVNPSVDIGQVEGAFMQGLGLYTLEELKFSPSGLLYTRGPSQYKIPAICDVPLRLNVYLLPNSHNPHAIYSSKGIGEPVLFLGSSVFFAIKDAAAAARSESGLIGPFSLDSPATPEKACLACASPFIQKIPASEPGSFKPWALNI